MLAGGSLGAGGCVDRAYDFDIGDFPSTDDSGTGTTGPDPRPTTSNPTDPTTPGTVTITTDPTDPTDPTAPLPNVPGPPQLIEIRFLNNLTLELTFNEPMAPPTGVDPMQFRLSWGSSYTYGYGYRYSWTNYREVGNYNGGETCYEYCWDPCDYYYGDSGCYGRKMCNEYCWPMQGPPVRGISLAADPLASHKIQLGIDNGINGSLCTAIKQYEDEPWAQDLTSELLLHFTDNGVPVTDETGELLEPFGERWAIAYWEPWDYAEGFFPELLPLLPIPCPF